MPTCAPVVPMMAPLMGDSIVGHSHAHIVDDSGLLMDSHLSMDTGQDMISATSNFIMGNDGRATCSSIIPKFTCAIDDDGAGGGDTGGGGSNSGSRKRLSMIGQQDHCDYQTSNQLAEDQF